MMTWLGVLRARFVALFWKGRLEQELDDELRSHLEMLVAENVRKGMSPQEARYAAMRSFGGVEQTKENYREQRGLPVIETVVQDLRYGLRMLAKNPGFTAVAVLTLALGIGANTAIFSLIDAVMLKLLPVRNPGELVLMSWAVRSQPGIVPWFLRSLSGDSDQDATGRFTSTSFSYPAFEDIRARTQAFSGVLGFADADRLNVSVNGQPGLAVGQF